MIPAEALDDRLAFVGTTGSGKTYAAGTAVERLLVRKARCVIIDPLDVWWGLRVRADGIEPSTFPVVIFGGAHGDLPLNEYAGALLGETVASMAESCIVSLGSLTTKAAERRFMLAFLEALYRKALGEPFHLIFDEADLWAPQKASEPMLQNLMEQIVRRGRVKGFIPWLITQRPAVLSKDVLSQADGLVALKLTASQDRDALGAWIEGQADRAEEKRILARLPQMPRGHGVVWIPGRGILKEVSFPQKVTFDSSRTPKRGEKKRIAELRPINLGALKERLVSIEAETKANDPKALRRRIAELERELAKKPAAGASPAQLKEAWGDGHAQGHFEGQQKLATALVEPFNRLSQAVEEIKAVLGERLGNAIPTEDGAFRFPDALSEALKLEARPYARQQQFKDVPKPARQPKPVVAAPRPIERAPSGEVTRPQQRVLDALAWFEAVGVPQPSKTAAAFVAGYTAGSGAINNLYGALRALGYVEYPGAGSVALTTAGRELARQVDAPPTSAALQDMVRARLPAPLARVLTAALDSYPEPVSKSELAERSGYTPGAGAFNNSVGRLRSLGLVDYPTSGQVRACDVLFIG